MKVVQSSIFRAVVAFIVGVLLVKYREDTMKWITITAGLLFFVSGLLSCAVYYLERRKAMNEALVTDANGKMMVRRMPAFPIVGIGSIILGIILAFMPTDFIIGVTYVLATILILGALNQLLNLFRARQYSYIPVLFWLFPLITLVVGILVLCKPMAAATLPLQIIGWCLMFYGAIEVMNALKIHAMKKAFEKADNVVTPVSEEVEKIEQE